MTSQTTPSLLSIQDLTNIYQKENIYNVPFTPTSNQPALSEVFDLNHCHKHTNENKPLNTYKSTSAITIASTKPSLTSVKSRNDLIQYALSKNYEEDNYNYTNDNRTSYNKIKNTSENISPHNNEYDELLYQQEKNLPVPISKKNDEKFKLLKMKSFKRMSLPMNKSVKRYENEKAIYEKEFNNCKPHML